MIRVVLDTNIVISALRQPQGLPARTFLIALAGTTAQLCGSGDVYAEYEEVIRRPKFNRGEAVIEHALRAATTEQPALTKKAPKGCGVALARRSSIRPTLE